MRYNVITAFKAAEKKCDELAQKERNSNPNDREASDKFQAYKNAELEIKMIRLKHEKKI